MKVIAQFLTEYVISKGAIDKGEREVYQYGFQVALETAMCVITSLVIAVFLHAVPEGILFFIIFIPLRSYAGGLHLKNFSSCYILSCLTFSVVLYLSEKICISVVQALVLLLISECLIIYMYPVENDNRFVEEDENHVFKRRLLFFLALDTLLAIGCWVLKKQKFLIVICLTVLVVLITMLLGKIRMVLPRKKGDVKEGMPLE